MFTPNISRLCASWRIPPTHEIECALLAPLSHEIGAEHATSAAPGR